MRATTFSLSCALMACGSSALASTVYSGLDFSYEYAGFGDITQEASQDRITDNVWLTRGSIRGLFNIAQEGSFQGGGNSGPSPIGTLWAYGNTSEIDTLNFVSWGENHDGFPPGMVDRNAVVYLEADDIYIDLMFTSWGGSGTGGEFSYLRSAVPTPASSGVILLGSLMAGRRRR